MHWQGFLIIAAGGFSILGAVMDWDWFMNNYRARLFVSLLGRGGARVLYVVLGGILVASGVFALTIR